MELQEKLVTAAKWIGAFAAAQWAQIPQSFEILMLLMGADVLTGFMAGIKTRSLSSRSLTAGLFKKTAIFVLVFAAHYLELALGAAVQADIEIHLEIGMALAYSVGEGISILENCRRLDVPIPEPLVKFLLSAKNKMPMADKALMDKLNEPGDGADGKA